MSEEMQTQPQMQAQPQDQAQTQQLVLAVKSPLESLFDVGEEEKNEPQSSGAEAPTAQSSSTDDNASQEKDSEEGQQQPPQEADDQQKPSPKDADEVSQLRAILREQNKRLRELQLQIDRSTAELTDKGLLEEKDEEEAQVAAREHQLRAAMLETILETMRLNPKYEDVDTVVTQNRFDDMVEGYANGIASERGGRAEDYLDAVAAKIWSMTNPYKFLYDNIKTYHPDFASKKEEEVQKTQTPVKQPKTHTAPQTISNLPSSSEEVKSGWTSARIDAMAEEDLHTVPRDVYQKYLSGALD